VESGAFLYAYREERCAELAPGAGTLPPAFPGADREPDESGAVLTELRWLTEIVDPHIGLSSQQQGFVRSWLVALEDRSTVGLGGHENIAAVANFIHGLKRRS